MTIPENPNLLHPKHMTDNELAEAYDEVLFYEGPNSLYDEQVIKEHEIRTYIITDKYSKEAN
jgi:hypothetical protein